MPRLRYLWVAFSLALALAACNHKEPAESARAPAPTPPAAAQDVSAAKTSATTPSPEGVPSGPREIADREGSGESAWTAQDAYRTKEAREGSSAPSEATPDDKARPAAKADAKAEGDKPKRRDDDRRPPAATNEQPVLRATPTAAKQPPVAPTTASRPVAHGGTHHPVAATSQTTYTGDKVLRPLPPPPRLYPRDARYRSNYLPGRGALDHLTAEIDAGAAAAGVTLASLAVPAPRSLPPPSEHSVRVAADLSRRVLPTEGGRTVLRVRLRSSDRAPASRGPIQLHAVLDASGSMKGKPWTQVCAALRDLATRLGPTDRLSVTVFNDKAWLLAPPTAGGPELAAVADKVCHTVPRGETNTQGGLQLGYQQARSVYDPAATNRVLLMSDGMPTIGPREPYELTIDTARALSEGITTSALGVGQDFDALLMDRVALEGGGNYHFVRDAKALPAVLTDELEVLSRQAAEAVDVRIRLPEDIELLEVVGSEPLGMAEALRVRHLEVATDQRLAREKGIATDRQRDVEGGVRFLLPSFRAGDEHAFVLVLGVPPGRGRHEVATIEVRYKDTVAGRNAAFEGTRWVDLASEAAAEAGAGEPDVLLAEARARAGAALQRASEYLAPQNTEAIRRELYAAALDLQRVGDATGNASAHAEADRLRTLSDSMAQALDRGQAAWMTTVLYYHWRMCGITAWAG